MGARNRRAEATPVGRLDLLLGGDRTVYTRWRPDGQVPTAVEQRLSGRAAAVAAVDWAVRSTLVSSGWTRRQVAGHLERVCRSTSAQEYGERCGTGAVRAGAPPVGTVGPTVVLGVAEESTTSGGAGALRLEWSVPPQSRQVSESARVLAALWVVADEAGHGEGVHHALYALRGGFERSGPFAESARHELVASLLAFGLDMAHTDERARTSRSRFTVVRD